MRPVDVLGLTLEAGSEAPVVLLREQHAPYRVLPIFVGPREAMAIALALSGQSPPRPLTHDLLAALIEALDSRVDHVEVTDVVDAGIERSEEHTSELQSPCNLVCRL